MKIYLDTIGCRLNQAEIETMARQFRVAGHEIVALADAERCDDPSVGVTVMSDIIPRYEALRYAYKILTKE